MTEPLRYSPADVLRAYMVAAGFVSSENATPWPSRVTNEPDTPDNCVTFYDSTGRDLGREHVSGARLELPGVQVRVRSSSHPDGYAKARTLAIALDAIHKVTVTMSGGYSYVISTVNRTTDVLALGKDAPNTARRIFTVDALVSLRQTQQP